MRVEVIYEIREYVSRQKITVAQYIATSLILELCLDA